MFWKIFFKYATLKAMIWTKNKIENLKWLTSHFFWHGLKAYKAFKLLESILEMAKQPVPYSFILCPFKLSGCCVAIVTMPFLCEIH